MLREITMTGRMQKRILASASAFALFAQAAFAADDWPTYGHDKGGQRYSDVKQITPANVAGLKPVWVYHMKPAVAGAASAPSAADGFQARADGAGPPRRKSSLFAQSEATPLVVGGKMFLTTPYHRVVALDADTGKELWAFDTGAAQPSTRGVEYWSGDATHPAEILFGTRNGLFYALDAATGKPISGFGTGGKLDLKTPEIMQGSTSPFYGLTSPPLVVGNLVVTGSATQEFPQMGAAGDIRAWDISTGKLVWTFHTIPRAGEKNAETWAANSGKGRSGVNDWGMMTADIERGLIFLALGAPTWDRYGGDRHGIGLYGNAVVALDAATGVYKWHFQIVHHDMWDMDAEAPPALIDVKRGGKTIPAVAVVSKSGLFFLLDRVTGAPIDPIEERPVPKSDVPGEESWPTQPFPKVTPPYARQGFSMDDVAKVTPELEAFCRKWITDAKMKMGGPYTPIGFNQPTIGFPGRQGGANWGGGSFDPVRGLFFVNANNLGQVEMLTKGEDGSIRMGGGSGPNARFSQSETKLMCQAPPWGELTAIDVSTGKIAWHSALGVSDNVPAAVANTGRPNVGGPITTAGGLVFIGATDDSRFRAFDAASGKEIWTYKLNASAHATPITYTTAAGKQLVAIVSTGGSFLDSPTTSDEVTAFGLP
jgi:quinoprotein glucose dehydrogenase